MCSLDVLFLDFLGDARSGSMCFRSKIRKPKERKNQLEEAQVRQVCSGFSKVVFSLDVFFLDFLGYVRSGMIGFKNENDRGRNDTDCTSLSGAGEQYTNKG